MATAFQVHPPPTLGLSFPTEEQAVSAGAPGAWRLWLEGQSRLGACAPLLTRNPWQQHSAPTDANLHTRTAPSSPETHYTRSPALRSRLAGVCRCGCEVGVAACQEDLIFTALSPNAALTIIPPKTSIPQCPLSPPRPRHPWAAGMETGSLDLLGDLHRPLRISSLRPAGHLWSLQALHSPQPKEGLAKGASSPTALGFCPSSGV